MHVHSLMAIALVVVTSAGAGEPVIFHTAQSADAKALNLSLLSNSISTDGDYDFDVLIGLTETDVNGATVYVDSGKHPARVRCSAPAKVRVGGVDYPVGRALNRSERDNWKENLWRAVCIAYVS